MALAVAPLGVSLNNQFLRPTVNGLIEFSLRLFEKLRVILSVVFDCQAMTRRHQESAFLFAGGILFAVHAYGFSPLRFFHTRTALSKTGRPEQLDCCNRIPFPWTLHL